jgi:ketosteroid isomerase-like protein
MERQEFARYLDALKSHDYATFKQYYTDDYRAYFDGGTFDRDTVVEVERSLASICDTNLDILQFVLDPEGAAIHAIMEMRFTRDAPPGFALGPRKAGERVKTRFCGFYRLRGDKICEFRVFPFLGETLD